MRETFRRFWLLVSTSVRTSPGYSATALTETVGRAISALGTATVALFVDGAIEHDATRVILAAAGFVVSRAVYMALGNLGGNARVRLMEHIGFAFDRQIAEITAAIPSLEHHERAEYGNQLQILRQNRSSLGNALNYLVSSLNAIVGAAVLLATAAAIEPRLLLLAVTAVPAVVSSSLRYRWRAVGEEASAQPGRLARALTELATDAEPGMELRVFGLRAEIRARLREAHRRWQAPLVRAERRWELVSLADGILFALVVTAIMGWLLYDAGSGGVSAGNGGVSAGTLVFAAYAARSVQESIVGSVIQSGYVGESLRSAGRVLWLRDHAARMAARYAGRQPPPDRLRRGIRLEGVSFTYPGASRPALHDVTVDLPAGSVTALVGENGAGKTTLVTLLTGLHQPTTGRVLLDDADLADLDIARWRASGTAAFQDHAQLELLAREAVGVGHLPAIDDERAVRQALDAAAAGDVPAALPYGLATQLGATWPGGVDLSGGQWQKLALGRAMMAPDPLLLVLDEPTAALDAPTEHALFTRYADAARRASARGAITLLVTHRFSTVRAADHILVLHAGRLIERGTHADLIAAGGHYAELYHLQARGYR